MSPPFFMESGGCLAILSVVIPVYNEINAIAAVVHRVRHAVLPEGVGLQIIIIDDCSTDGTREYLQSLDDSYIVLLQKCNKGKGAAVRAGLHVASGDYIVIQDADLEYDPTDFSRLLAPILSGDADVVYGSRFLSRVPHSLWGFCHFLVNRFLTILSNTYTGLSLSDMETCYKMFSRKVAADIGPQLVSERFEIEPEITAKIAKAGYRIREVAISYRLRSYAMGKKIGWKDGIEALIAIVRFR
jgi:glycosyltransferase involved in cell wall biosynthesis